MTCSEVPERPVRAGLLVGGAGNTSLRLVSTGIVSAAQSYEKDQRTGPTEMPFNILGVRSKSGHTFDAVKRELSGESTVTFSCLVNAITSKYDQLPGSAKIMLTGYRGRIIVVTKLLSDISIMFKPFESLYWLRRTQRLITSCMDHHYN